MIQPYILKLSHRLKRFHARTEKWLDEPIGRIEGNMLFEDAFQVRVHKHPYIEFIQKVQLDAANVRDILYFIISRWGWRIP